MKRGLFKRIFVLYGAILALSLVVMEVYVTNEVRADRIDTLRDHLAVQSELVSPDIPFQSLTSLDSLCRRLKETTRARVTIIAPDGRVMGDSDHDSASMENHGSRIEVQQAKLAGTGMTIRHSDTLGYDFLYVAKQIVRRGSAQGVIRLSVPLKDVDASINALRFKLVLVLVLILLAAALFPFWQIDRLRRLTNRIRDFSGSIARGAFGDNLFVEHAGEFDEIAESLNTMSTALKKSIASHEEEQRRLNVILWSVPDALFIMDGNGAISLSSAAAKSVFGDIAFAGRPFIEVVRNAEFASLMDEVRKHHTVGVAEVRIDSPFERYCVVQVSPLFYGNERELSGFVAVFHDVTQLKKLEQMRKDFVANLSHELKTPVTAIMGFAETLLDGAIDDRPHAIKFLETIRSNSGRINSLVDDLMTISKIELGVIRIEPALLSIGLLMEQVIDTLADKAREKGLALALAVPSPAPEIIADKDRLLQILTNLADNAIKFTEQGTVTLGAGREHDRTFLFVRDTGIGIQRKHLPRLGERFYRVDPGRSRTMGGTGLGLAIVKHLVKAHGWDLQIESVPEKGTTVKVFITQ